MTCPGALALCSSLRTLELPQARALFSSIIPEAETSLSIKGPSLPRHIVRRLRSIAEKTTTGQYMAILVVSAWCIFSNQCC